MLYTFTSNKSYPYLLNVESRNLAFLGTYKAEFDDIIIKFTDQNGKPLELEGKFNLALPIKKKKWHVIL